MSYDLHGVWDADDPIGNHVLAHTNLTEINDALDLFWRNDVPADKLNLGLGFYGRTFQLSDPGCSAPGCLFKGGASPGPCTKNSGTLSYSELMDVIKQYSLTPTYDKENAVKYITWNNDQWASFDDQDTFQQKIKFANKLGLGGLLIWALDLDTQDLQALSGVIYPKTISSLQAQADTVDNWSDVNGGDCRGTTCGSTGCQPGEIEMTTFQCDGDGNESTVCCPLSSAPDPNTCSWQGTAPFCNGQCLVGQVALVSGLWGDGDYCSDGRKFYCCDVQEEAKKIDCRWGDCGSSCDDDEDQLTWRYGDCWDGEQPFCCKREEDWQNCAWHGEPGSCFDDHCDTGHQVELANSYEGEGEDCGWQLSRTRVFCCDPPADQSPFLPVELDWLFPNPPPEDIAKTEYKLKTDPTFGGAVSIPFANEPESASFGFIVLTSPETIQVSLDKRDGSHWEVFDCFDAVSETEHTVRMVCSDDSPSSNCHKIYQGRGVPGTILEMPEGCGPGKYAVAVDLTPSQNQTLPSHLDKRDRIAKATIYDLRFDYDFARVPRDMGDTQMRIDYANEDGYWDKVVDKAASSKRKRSLEEHKGNHRRWLEEAWREDKHFSELSEEELHKRWFGEDIISWLKGILNGVTGDLAVHHSYTEDFTAILLRESWTCSSGITTTSAQLDVEANVHVGINTNFGLTIIATLGSPIDLSSSYLYFRNDGEITARFTLDALASVNFDTGDMTLLSADKFGAAFAVPGIVTIGPNFKLLAQVEGGITASAHLEAQVNVAKWNVQQTFPDANSDWDPKATEDVDPSGTQDVTPTNERAFDASVSANGYLTAHLKPEVVFGIEFNKAFIPVDPAAVNLVADGFITAYADASASISGGASFCYGVDAGAQLYATIDVPGPFKWTLPQSRFQIGPQLDFQIIPQTCPVGNSRRDLLNNDTALVEGIWEEPHLPPAATPDLLPRTSIERRGAVYGPIIHLPSNVLQGPGQTPSDNATVDKDICDFCKDLPGNTGSTENTKRDGDACRLPQPGDPDEPSCRAPSSGASKRSETGLLDKLSALWERTVLDKRDRKKITWATSVAGLSSPEELDCGAYPACSEAINVAGVPKYYTWNSLSNTCDGRVSQQSLATVQSFQGRSYQSKNLPVTVD
jgi:chitinase